MDPMEQITQERDKALKACAEAYQVLGALAHATDTFDHPDVIRALDNLADPLNAPHADLLPWPRVALKGS